MLFSVGNPTVLRHHMRHCTARSLIFVMQPELAGIFLCDEVRRAYLPPVAQDPQENHARCEMPWHRSMLAGLALEHPCAHTVTCPGCAPQAAGAAALGCGQACCPSLLTAAGDQSGIHAVGERRSASLHACTIPGARQLTPHEAAQLPSPPADAGGAAPGPIQLRIVSRICICWGVSCPLVHLPAWVWVPLIGTGLLVWVSH